MRTLTLLLLFVSAGSMHATEPKISRDLPYADTKNKLQTLDIYAPLEGNNHPVAIWIHGGGWHSGDKAEMDNKPKAFTEKGYIFVSINYRLWTPPWTNSDHEGVRRFQWSPTFPGTVTLTDEAEDIAKAVRWVRDHIQEYGGNRDALVVLGHSAGASLAALVCTDDRYLKGEGVPLAVIKACVPVDGDAYDIPLHMKTAPARQAEIDRHRFGDDQLQFRLSPVTHVAKGKNIPHFSILHVADHPPDHVAVTTVCRCASGSGSVVQSLRRRGNEPHQDQFRPGIARRRDHPRGFRIPEPGRQRYGGLS